MKLLLLLFTPLLFVGVTSAQIVLEEPNANTDNHIKTTYDREKNITVMETLPYLLDEATGGCPDFLTVRGAYVHPGERLTAGRYYVTFVCRGSEWTFDPQSELSFIADGEIISVGRGDRIDDSGSDPIGKSTYEELVFQVRMGDLNAIAKAKKVELQVGSVKSQLPSVANNGFRQLIARTSIRRTK